MKTTMSNDSHIEYPYNSNIFYKGLNPFIRIYKNDRVFYGIANTNIQLIELHRKPIHSFTLLSGCEHPDSRHISILNQVTKQVRGMHYQLLYVYKNQYICLGFIRNQTVAFVKLTIDLNTKGYYEIQNIVDIIESLNE